MFLFLARGCIALLHHAIHLLLACKGSGYRDVAIGQMSYGESASLVQKLHVEWILVTYWLLMRLCFGAALECASSSLAIFSRCCGA